MATTALSKLGTQADVVYKSGYNLLTGLISEQQAIAEAALTDAAALTQDAVDYLLDVDGFEDLPAALEDIHSRLEQITDNFTGYDGPVGGLNLDWNVDTDFDTNLDAPEFAEIPPTTFDFNVRPAPQIDGDITDVQFQQPDVFDEQAPDVDVSDISFDMPDASPPERPEFFDITLPTPPDLSVLQSLGQPLQDPQFQGSIPQDAAQTYSDRLNSFYSAEIGRFDDLMHQFVVKFFPEQEIQRDILDTYIKDFVEGRNSLFTERVEELIYTRQQNRNDLQYLREREDVLRTAQETSNPIMPARVQAQLLRVSESAAARNTESAIAVTERRLQTEIEQLRFSLQMLYSLRELMLQTRNTEFNAKLGLLQACLQDAAQFASVLYEAADRYIQLYAQDINKARLEIENLERLREDARLELDLYLGKMRGAEIQSRINDSIAGRYGTEAQVFATIYQAADSQIRAKIALAELRKIPLDVFIAKANAYGQYSRGIEAFNNSLKAIIDGDTAKINAQEAELKGWETELRGKQIEGQLRLAEQDAVVRQNEAKANIAVAEARVKEAGASLKKLAGDAKLQLNSARMDEFNAEVRQALERYRAINAGEIETAKLKSQYADIEAQVSLAAKELLLSRNKAIADALTASGGIYGSIAQSLFNGINLVVNAGDIIEFEDFSFVSSG